MPYVGQEILTVAEHVILHPLWCPFQISSFCIVLFRVEQEILTVPEHVILHPLWCPFQISSFCMILCKTRDYNCSGALDLIFVSCGSFCSFVLFSIVFALFQSDLLLTKSVLFCVHKYVQKYVILTNFHYKHSTYVTPVKSVVG